MASPAHKQMVLSTQAGDKLLFKSMRASEELGRLYEFDIVAVSESSAIAPLDLLGTPAHVAVLQADGSERCFHGLVAEMGAEGIEEQALYRYRLVLRPSLWLLTRRADTRIFQGLSVVDILHKVLDPLAPDLALELNGHYPALDYCVQYRESDFNFISRLMEREGIYYHFRHARDRHELVLVDAVDNHQPCPVQHQFRFTPDAHGDGGHFDSITEWQARRRIESGTVSLADHDWLKPATSLLVTAKAGDKGRPARLEVYDYPCHYAAKGEGERYAGVRLQEQGARLQQAEGAGPLRSLAVGCTFVLDKHPQPSENGKYLAVATVHEISSSSYFSGDGETRNDCRFIAIPAGQHYGSERKAVRTRVAGLQTAQVVGPAGEEIYTDEHGRVKLQFHWDRLGKRDENSSCWVRVATPWAGAMRGWVSVPRIGDEVVVDFLEGDPDRPLIIGSVYNGANAPPWELPANRTQSGLLTRSSKGGSGHSNANVLRFEDKKGAEQVWLHAEKDQLIEVEHDEDHQVGNDRRKSIGQDETTDVGRNRSESVGKDETISIGANRSETVGKNESISIADNRSEDVGKNETIAIGKNRDETVGDNETVAIGKNREHKIGKEEKLEVGDNRSAQIGKDDKLQVGKKLYIEAGDEITLVTGSTSLSMKKDGTIQLKGKDITITGSGKIGIKASGDVVIKGSKIAEN